MFQRGWSQSRHFDRIGATKILPIETRKDVDSSAPPQCSHDFLGSTNLAWRNRCTEASVARQPQSPAGRNLRRTIWNRLFQAVILYPIHRSCSRNVCFRLDRAPRTREIVNSRGPTSLSLHRSIQIRTWTPFLRRGAAPRMRTPIFSNSSRRES